MKKIINILLILILSISMASCTKSKDDDLMLEDTYQKKVKLKTSTIKTNQQQTQQEDEIAINALSDKKTIINIENVGRETPFVPYKEKNLLMGMSMRYRNIPMPPELGTLDENISELAKAKVTGILYDNRNPSAIVNILDQDYFVKIGDKIEQFKINDIKKDYVSIKTGLNTYHAKVGEIVEGEVYPGGAPNIGHKFAGTIHPSRKEDVIEIKAVSKEKKQEKQDGLSPSQDPKQIKNITAPTGGGKLPEPPTL